MFNLFKKKEQKPKMQRLFLDEYQYEYVINNTNYVPQIQTDDYIFTAGEYYIDVPQREASLIREIIHIGYCRCCGQLQK